MTEKKPPDDVHVALPPHWERDAVPGNKRGNARAFGLAASLLKARVPIPAELADWLAVRLKDLHDALRDESDTRMHRVVPALRLQETGKRGVKAAGPLENTLKVQLAWEVYYAARLRGSPGNLPARATLDQVFEMVADRRNAALDSHRRAGNAVTGLRVSAAKVEAAWKARRKLDPAFPELTPAT